MSVSAVLRNRVREVCLSACQEYDVQENARDARLRNHHDCETARPYKHFLPKLYFTPRKSS